VAGGCAVFATTAYATNDSEGAAMLAGSSDSPTQMRTMMNSRIVSACSRTCSPPVLMSSSES